jgi:ABC-type multidrug transport system fused ATPase/permease subunit
MSLLLLFYRPSRGEICFDGTPAANYELSSLRQRIGFVLQATLLLEGSIRDNLAYGNPEATQEQIEQACRVAGIHEYISGLPDQYESIVGERGVNLSEGQKQRLSIARALIKDPDILILDEPTSALDHLTERSIFEALPQAIQGKTLLVAAHRLSTIQKADQILVLQNQRLAAAGTHAELLAENEYYRSLLQLNSEPQKSN